MDDLDDDAPKKTPRATVVRRWIVGLLALACAGGWIYTRYLVKKETLGGTCSYDMHCRAEAPRCLKQSTDGDGVCSRPCDGDGDCAPGIACVEVELDEYDERGRPLKGGYCFPQALLDARKKRRSGDAGAPKTSDSWIEVPEAPGQLEGEVVFERGKTKTTYAVKGTLVAVAHASKRKRTIVDASTLRRYTVDDDAKTFAASQIGVTGGDATVTKTDRTDRVAGRDCDVWRIEAGSGVREACVLAGGAFVEPSARAVPAWEKELAVRGVFPLRVSAGGKDELVASKLDAHPVDASRFVIPKTYDNLAGR